MILNRYVNFFFKFHRQWLIWGPKKVWSNPFGNGKNVLLPIPIRFHPLFSWKTFFFPSHFQRTIKMSMLPSFLVKQKCLALPYLINLVPGANIGGKNIRTSDASNNFSHQKQKKCAPFMLYFIKLCPFSKPLDNAPHLKKSCLYAWSLLFMPLLDSSRSVVYMKYQSHYHTPRPVSKKYVSDRLHSHAQGLYTFTWVISWNSVTCVIGSMTYPLCHTDKTPSKNEERPLQNKISPKNKNKFTFNH